MKIDFRQPEFFLCEIPTKDGSYNDNRIWVYHRLSLSLIEFILVNDFADFEFNRRSEVFLYENEEWLGVFVQNNCDSTDHDETDVINCCWEFLKNYFIWKEKKIDEEKN